MINLLYVILIAMLAINISGDVLDGFNTADKDSSKNVAALKAYNDRLTEQLVRTNPADAEKVVPARQQAESLGEIIGTIKNSIADMAKENSFSKNMDVDDDLNSVKTIMLDKEQPQAAVLKKEIDKLRELCLPLIGNTASYPVVESLLSTRPHDAEKTWEEEHFGNLPVVGSFMMMSKIEENAWLALNETMECLNGNTVSDSTDMKQAEVEEIDNELLESLVKQIEARNALARQQQNRIIKNEQGHVEAVVMSENRAPLFENYENRINISVVSNEGMKQPQVSMTNGKIRKDGDAYVAIPDGNTHTATLTVKADGKTLATYTYNVMPLPLPKAVLTYTSMKGQQREYRSNVPLDRKEIRTISEVKLLMDHGIDTKESVAGFDLMIVKNGNKTTYTAHADGARLTDEMKELLGNAVKGDKIFFMNITVKGKNTAARQAVSVNVIPM